MIPVKSNIRCTIWLKWKVVFERKVDMEKERGWEVTSDEQGKDKGKGYRRTDG